MIRLLQKPVAKSVRPTYRETSVGSTATETTAPIVAHSATPGFGSSRGAPPEKTCRHPTPVRIPAVTAPKPGGGPGEVRPCVPALQPEHWRADRPPGRRRE
ncbi:hypothetical protein AArcCO_1341 [Halalkaliarchaeum sp. AArc-CO]|nr:hypothetical protein AArcCO_1341 [Halalkaliarchaeum sp. AArc-CO]